MRVRVLSRTSMGTRGPRLGGTKTHALNRRQRASRRASNGLRPSADVSPSDTASGDSSAYIFGLP
jgi:hypothetical protein